MTEEEIHALVLLIKQCKDDEALFQLLKQSFATQKKKLLRRNRTFFYKYEWGNRIILHRGQKKGC